MKASNDNKGKQAGVLFLVSKYILIKCFSADPTQIFLDNSFEGRLWPTPKFLLTVTMAEIKSGTGRSLIWLLKYAKNVKYCKMLGVKLSDPRRNCDVKE